MIYTYKCSRCKKITEVTKSMNDSDREEFCEKCNNKLDRVYEAPTIKLADGLRKG